MAAEQATAEDIRIWFSEDELDEDETKRANLILKNAYALITLKLGKESLFNAACASIQLQMAVRVWNNQNLLSQGGVGPENGTFALGQYGLYLTFAEEALINEIKRKVGLNTIRTVRNDGGAWIV